MEREKSSGNGRCPCRILGAGRNSNPVKMEVIITSPGAGQIIKAKDISFDGSAEGSEGKLAMSGVKHQWKALHQPFLQVQSLAGEGQACHHPQVTDEEVGEGSVQVGDEQIPKS